MPTTDDPPSPRRTQVKLKAEPSSPITQADSQRDWVNASDRIRFLHPHYPAPTNVLLDLLAPDRSNDGSGKGLEYGVAHTSCSVITGNRWDGYFTRSVNGMALIFGYGDIMPIGEYYFYIDGSNPENPYPIVPMFRSWTFPHDNLPPLWQNVLGSSSPPVPISSRYSASSNFTSCLLNQNINCRMTGCGEGTEAAHLCPRSELDWLLRNGMTRYYSSLGLSGNGIVNDTSNALLLRQDLHTQFDTIKFVFVPKKESTTDADWKVSVVTHLLKPSQELEFLYHNTKLRPIPNVHPAFLLVRFAWAMFKFVEPFLLAGVNRNVLVIAGQLPRMLSGSEYKKLVTRTRSESPTKRSKRTLPDEDDGGGPGDTVLQDIDTNHQHSQKRRQHGSSFQSSFLIPKTVGSQNLPPATDPEVAISEEETLQAPPIQTSALREEWIKIERQRSDPKNTWVREQAWVDSVWKGKTILGPEEARRFFEDCGEEFRDLDEREG